MNVDFIFHQVFRAYVYFFTIYASYHFTKEMVRMVRRKKYYPASVSEKVGIWLASIAWVAFISFILSGDGKNSISWFIAIFIILMLPVFLGIKRAFEIDKKLSDEERLRFDLKIRSQGD